MQIIFEPFKQLESSEQSNVNVNNFQQGDGLVQQHVMAMRGILCIASTVGVGSLFFCAFPAQPCSPSDSVDNLNNIGSQRALHHVVKTFNSVVSSGASSTGRAFEHSGYKLTEKHPPVATTESTSFQDCTSTCVGHSNNVKISIPSLPSNSTSAIFLVVDDSPVNLRLLKRKIELAFDKDSSMQITNLMQLKLIMH